MKILCLLSLFISLSLHSAPREKEWRIVIENNYKRSKKIWGTYGLTSEKSSITNKKKAKSQRRNPEANMMLKGGKMVLIHPTNKNGTTSYKVKSFPYKRKAKKTYHIELNSKKDLFLEIYRQRIMAILKRNKIDPTSIDWKSLELDKMSCVSKRVNFNCKIPLLIKAKSNS